MLKKDEIYKKLRFRASLDYVTIGGVSKVPLPPLDGEAIWPRSEAGRLTIQRCSASDAFALSEIFPLAVVTEMEVCVDAQPIKSLTREESRQLLESFKAEVAMGLKPKFMNGTNSEFRGAYKPALRKVLPFNHRIPKANEQQLYGHRGDSAQAKTYLKVTDNKADLDWTQHVVRVEVRLSVDALRRHGIHTLADLLGFPYRKEFMPYFTHVDGSRLRRGRQHSVRPMLRLLNTKQEQTDARFWSTTGVGAFVGQGKRRCDKHVFRRNSPLNNRIGQALTRMNQAFAVEKFVQSDQVAGWKSSTASMTSGDSGQSSMTY